MYFIGSGGLLSRAVDYCLTNGLKVDGACCPPGDSAVGRLRSRGGRCPGDPGSQQ